MNGGNAARFVIVLFRPFDDRAVSIRSVRRVEDGVREHRRGDVAQTLDSIAPAAVVVLMRGQPIEAPVDQGLQFLASVGRASDLLERHYGCRG